MGNLSDLAKSLSKKSFKGRRKKAFEEQEDMGKEGNKKAREKARKLREKYAAEQKAIKEGGSRAMAGRTFGDSVYPEGAYTSQTINTASSAPMPLGSPATRKIAGMVSGEQTPVRDFKGWPSGSNSTDMVPEGMKKGGKVRGVGKAIKGVRPVKMR
jgi:hypothetical protein